MSARAERCGVCGKAWYQGVTLYNVGHGPRCAQHFTGAAAKTKAKRERKK